MQDWRLREQEKYLMKCKLHFIEFKKLSDEWDHAHCEFCWDKFSECDGDMHMGYCTEPHNSKNARWICPDCFNDFKDSFMWES